VDPSESLFLFLEEVALISDVDSLTEDDRGPALLTLHAAKGLEFRVVFIVGLDEGLFPHNRSMDDVEAMEEERRLCYVGVSRAMDHLYLLHTFRRTIFGTNELSAPSRFLVDLPSELVKGQSAATMGGQAQQVRLETQLGSSAGLHGITRWASSEKPIMASNPTRPQFQIGDTVLHAKFGEGVVIKSHVTDNDQEIEVAFPDRGIKKLSVNFAPLKKKQR
jgi:DNA helicase-2/ATP-dependent DNA helicase PcrA